MLFLLFIVDAFAVAAPQQCKKNCEVPNSSAISFCTGFASHPACILDIYASVTDADNQARNRSDTLEQAGFNNGPVCSLAAKAFVCALFFPKCVPSNMTVPMLQFPCESTCADFFDACGIARFIGRNNETVDLCEPYSGPDRTAPSSICTGVDPADLFTKAYSVTKHSSQPDCSQRALTVAERQLKPCINTSCSSRTNSPFGYVSQSCPQVPQVVENAGSLYNYFAGADCSGEAVLQESFSTSTYDGCNTNSGRRHTCTPGVGYREFQYADADCKGPPVSTKVITPEGCSVSTGDSRAQSRTLVCAPSTPVYSQVEVFPDSRCDSSTLASASFYENPGCAATPCTAGAADHFERTLCVNDPRAPGVLPATFSHLEIFQQAGCMGPSIIVAADSDGTCSGAPQSSPSFALNCAAETVTVCPASQGSCAGCASSALVADGACHDATPSQLPFNAPVPTAASYKWACSLAPPGSPTGVPGSSSGSVSLAVPMALLAVAGLAALPRAE